MMIGLLILKFKAFGSIRIKDPPKNILVPRIPKIPKLLIKISAIKQALPITINNNPNHDSGSKLVL